MIEQILNSTSVVDLFCGIGGLSHGFFRERFRIAAGIDLDHSCRYAFETNNESTFVCRDVSAMQPEELNELFGDVRYRILVGCAPCQPFSSYTNYTNKENQEKDDKWKLLNSFAQMVDAIEPEVISMENVPQLVSFDKEPIFKNFIGVLERKGYSVDAQIVYCPDYGIPQKRKRLVVVASRLGEINLMAKTHSPEKYETVRKAIGSLNPIEAGQYDPADALHSSRNLSEINKRRIKASKPGGDWSDWPEELLLDCHKKESGKSFASVYGRMEWDAPSPTITTLCTGIGNGRFGHPEQDRAISLREAALLQTFPKEYKFFDSSVAKPSFQKISRQLGNAVPVTLGQVIAKTILEHLLQLNNGNDAPNDTAPPQT